MNKSTTATATAIALVSLAWAGTAGAQVADSCVLNAERFVALDRDADGALSEMEYMACTDAATSDARQALRDQFATIDRDRDMSISNTEAEQFVAEAPQDAVTPPTDAPKPAGQAGLPLDEHPTAGPSAVQSAPATAQNQAPPAIPAPPMGQREVTRGPLPLTPGSQAGSTAQGPAPSVGSGPAAVAAAPARPEADPAQWQPLIGAKVTNLAGESLGELSRLVTKQGNEQAAVIESGGFLGFGAAEYVVPLQQLQIQGDHAALNMPKQDLKQLPKFQKSEWQETAK